MTVEFSCRQPPFAEAPHIVRVFERILRADQPPDIIEPELFEGEFAGVPVTRVCGIEGAAQKPDAQSVLDRPRRGNPIALCTESLQRDYGRVWPLPRTTYLKIVSCSTPTGPRAWSLPVPMPISAPITNSPPSANCVEALCITIAESSA